MKKIKVILLIALIPISGFSQFNSYHELSSDVNPNASYVGTADWDADGDLDILYGSGLIWPGYEFSVQKNLGGNTFSTTVIPLETGATSETYKLLPLNLDGIDPIDYAYINVNWNGDQDNGDLYFGLREMDNSYTITSDFLNLPLQVAVNPCFDLTKGDLNNDGFDDLVYVNGSYEMLYNWNNTILLSDSTNISVMIFMNDGAGNMLLHQDIEYTEDDGDYIMEDPIIQLADLNNDGLLDIQIHGGYNAPSNGHMNAFLAGNDSYFTEVQQPVTAIEYPLDFNGDGLLDLIEVYNSDPLVYLFQDIRIRINDGMNSYLPQQTIAYEYPTIFYSYFARTNGVAVTDVNNDGYDDLYLFGQLHLNNSGNGFAAIELTSNQLLYGNFGFNFGAAFADFNDDGYPELVGAEFNPDFSLSEYVLHENCGNAPGCYPTLEGCTDPNACNYDVDAVFDNGQCNTDEADLNCDGIISTRDVLIFNQHFSCTGPDLACDFDLNGVVGVSDLIVLISSYGEIVIP